MSIFDDVKEKVVGDPAVEETYGGPLTVIFEHTPEDRSGTFQQAPGSNPADDWPEENLVVWESVTPACPPEGDCMSFAKGRLCHACWFAEFVSQVGEGEAFADHVTWEGRGVQPATVMLEGYMRSETYGSGEVDDRFDCEVVGVAKRRSEG